MALTPAQEIEDYRVFTSGKEFFSKGNYSNAKTEFEFLLRNYPDSLLLKNKYANYYIGMTYYRLGDYSKARYYLESAIYIPKEFQDTTGYFRPKKKHYFEYERNFYLAQIYLELNDTEEGLKHLKFLIKDYYTFELAQYEGKALQQLAGYDPYYGTLYKIKYENNISLLPSLRIEDLITVGDFFVSKGLYDNATNAYSLALKEDPTHEVKVKLLESLTREKRYEDVLRITSDYLRTDPQSDFYYYRANAFRRRGRIDDAIRDFRRVQRSKFAVQARYDTARLLYLRKQYTSAISILRTLDTSRSHTLLMNTYKDAGMEEEFSQAAVAYIKKYPYSDEAAYYRFLLYKMSSNENYLTWIKKYNFNTYYYEVANSINATPHEMELFPLNDKLAEYRHIIDRLEKLSTLGDSEILRMNFETLELPEDDRAFEGYLISMIYEEGGFYHQAIKNSRAYSSDLSRYSNLVDILYPRYYSRWVNSASAKYQVEPALIYAVIMKESLFSKNVVSKSGAYGLMQMILSTGKDMKRDVTPEELLNPQINIDLGTRYLKILLDRYHGDVTKTIAAYNGGMGNVDRWSQGQDLDIDSIPFPETQNYTKDVLSNYHKYKRLYNQ